MVIRTPRATPTESLESRPRAGTARLPESSRSQRFGQPEGRAPAIARPQRERRQLAPRPPDDSSHYAILQIKPFADPATIREAYRRLARQAHPDVNPAADATQQMRMLNEAYAILRDPGLRAAYDGVRIAQALRAAGAGVSAPPPPAPPRPRVPWYCRVPWYREGRGVLRRALGALGAVGVIVTVIGCASLAWTPRPEPPPSLPMALPGDPTADARATVALDLTADVSMGVSGDPTVDLSGDSPLDSFEDLSADWATGLPADAPSDYFVDLPDDPLARALP
jgi:hypothetical protein